MVVTAVNANAYRIADFEFQLICGRQFLDPALEVADAFLAVLEPFSLGTVKLNIDDLRVMDIDHSLTIPHPFPMRDFRDFGQVVAQFRSDQVRFTWRAGEKPIFQVEVLDKATSAAEAVGQIEPIILAIALGNPDFRPFIDGVCLQNNNGKKVLIIGETSSQTTRAWLTALFEVEGAMLLSSESVLLNPVNSSILPLARAPRLSGRASSSWARVGDRVVLGSRASREAASAEIDELVVVDSQNPPGTLDAIELRVALMPHLSVSHEAHGELVRNMLRTTRGQRVTSDLDSRLKELLL